ncbi:hypothetical protein RZS08_05245, partial [Arthrospira platensis SPKY1]|nr:hypothetical protein [Arthrospira platensis SPKY1]
MLLRWVQDPDRRGGGRNPTVARHKTQRVHRQSNLTAGGIPVTVKERLDVVRAGDLIALHARLAGVGRR